MHNKEYKSALETAQNELTELLQERHDLDDRITGLRRTIIGLAELTGLVSDAPKLNFVYAMGLTDACRIILRSNYPASATIIELRKQLVDAGFDLSRYATPLSSMRTILNRLVSKGEAVMEKKDGKNVYKRKEGGVGHRKAHRS